MAKRKLGAGGRFSEAGNNPEAPRRQHAPEILEKVKRAKTNLNNSPSV
jgi:hypothetical protein